MSKKKIIIILIILALGVGLFVFKGSGNKDIIVDEMVATEDNGLANDFIKGLMGVENVSLDTSLLNSSLFKSLVPSGAYIDPNPNRGKTDPFSEISGTTVILNEGPETSPRDFGGLQSIDNSIKNEVKITASKITATTAYISVTGIPKGEKITVNLTGSNNVTIPAINLTYKDAESVYASGATGLTSKIKYSAIVESPIKYAGLQADFTTK